MIEIIIAAVIIGGVIITAALLLSYGMSGTPDPGSRENAYDRSYTPGLNASTAGPLPLGFGRKKDEKGRN
jgi:hypothetical protein